MCLHHWLPVVGRLCSARAVGMGVMGSWPAPYGMITLVKRSTLYLMNGIRRIYMIDSFQVIRRPSPGNFASSWKRIFFRRVPA